MPLSLGSDAPVWGLAPFIHLFADRHVEPQPTRQPTPALPEPDDPKQREKEREQREKDGPPKPNFEAFPIQPTLEFVQKILNNVHGLLPKSLDGVLELESEVLRKVESAFWQGVQHCQDFPTLSQNEIDFERFLQNFMRRLRGMNHGELMLIPIGWANVGPQARSIIEQNAEREKDPKVSKHILDAARRLMTVAARLTRIAFASRLFSFPTPPWSPRRRVFTWAWTTICCWCSTVPRWTPSAWL